MTPGILIFAEGNERIGMGHLMRMFALAQALKEQSAHVAFASNDLPPFFKAMLAHEGISTQAFEDYQVAVFDGYDYGDDDFQSASRSGALVCAMDDMGLLAHAPVDIIVNQNPGWGWETYSEFPGRAAIGLNYCLMRRSFWGERPRRRAFEGRAKRILISGGGADPKAMAAATIEALEELDVGPLDVMVLAGPANPALSNLERLARLSNHRITIVPKVGDMAGALAWADMGVFAAGSSMWECAWSGLPICSVIVADNQFKAAKAFAESGAAVAVDWRENGTTADLVQPIALLLANTELREKLSSQAQAGVDGQGAHRVAHMILDACIKR